MADCKRALLVALSGAWLISCSPGTIELPPDPSWAIGEFSSVSGEGVYITDLQQLSILDNGRARYGGYYGCGGSGSFDEGEEYDWEAESDNTIVIRVWSDLVDVRVTRIDCNTIQIHTLDGIDFGTYHRGPMCLEAQPYCLNPEGGECDPCRTAWCDGPPPPCE
jgi:hypothetical protein